MSESSKMGLFGSKDENSGAEAAEDENNQVPTVKETSTEVRDAPYNIDSDSETYDTEALSMLDINDIIGVQAESTNDSTLESEFAALSEIITDCKGEFSKIDEGIGAEEKAVGKFYRKNRESNITEGASTDSAREDTSKDSQADDKTSQDSGMASISKSLQLIGEAYISEDSQETDTEEIPEINTPKVTVLSECLKASTSNIQDAENHGEKLSGEPVESSSKETAVAEQSDVTCSTDSKEEIAVQETAEKPQEITAEAPNSPQIEKSVDSTDSAGVDKSLENPNEGDKTESMDIDCSSPENGGEPAATKNQLESKIESCEDQKVIAEPHSESTVLESEEPMEIDQASEESPANIETQKVDTTNDEREISNVENSSELFVTESTEIAGKSVAVDSEKSKESIDEVATNNKTFTGSDDVKETPIPDIHQEATTEFPKLREEENSKVREEEPEKGKSDSENLEMETDDTLIEGAVTEATGSEKSKTEIEEPTEELPSTIENVRVEVSQEKVEETQEAPESVEKVRDVEKEEIPSLVQKVAEVDLMEVDNYTSEKPETESGTLAVSSSALSEYSAATNISEIPQSEITTDAAIIAEPESSENIPKEAKTGPNECGADTLSENSSTAAKSIGTESESNIALENKASNESISDLSSKPLGETLSPIPEETGSDEIENDESLALVAESADKSAPIKSPQDEIIPDSTVNEFARRIPTASVEEDEKMEVDAAAKKEKPDEENSDICEPVTESQEPGASSSTVLEIKTTEEESIIGKAVLEIKTTEEESIIGKAVLEIETTEEESIIGKAVQEIETTEEESTIGKAVQEIETIEEESIVGKAVQGIETIEEESIIGKAGESDVQEEASLVLSAADTETVKTVEKDIESTSETSQTQLEETVSEAEEAEKIDGKVQEKELPPTEAKDECSMRKSPDIEATHAVEDIAVESLIADSKPETKEKENEASETPNVIETEKTVVDVPVEMKNEGSIINVEDSSITKEKEIDNTNPMEETVRNETVSEPDILVKSTEDYAQEISTNDPESPEIFSKPDAPSEATISKDTLSSMIEPDDVGEDPIEEEMNLSLDPEIGESQEEPIEKPQSVSPSLPLEETIVNLQEEIEENESMNLSPNREDKTNEAASIVAEEMSKENAEDCVDESSMTSTGEKPDESEDRFEKPYNYIDENSKDIEPTTASVPEMFHDEQSQTTQEMMESILEGDSSNLNKILDAEEAEGEARARSNALEQTEIEDLSDKLPSESEELLSKALDDPMSSQNIDSLEGLLDLDLIPETDEPTMKVVEPIAQKVLNETSEDIGIIGKDVDVSLLLDETEQAESYSNEVPKITEEIAESEAIAEVVGIVAKSDLDDASDLPITPSQLSSVDDSELIDNDLDVAFDLASVVSNPLEAVPLAEEEAKIDLAEDLLREIAVEEERKMGLAEQLFLESSVPEESNKIDLPTQILLSTGVQGPSKIDLPDENIIDNVGENIAMPDAALLESVDEADKNPVLSDPILPQATVAEGSKMELSEDISLASEIEDLAPGSEISELESAVKFLQESEEQDIDSSMALSPKLVDSVVEDITQESDVGIFAPEANICDDPSELVPELEDIIPDPIAISEAEIISEAAKLESERKTKEEAKLQSPIAKIVENEQEERKQLEIHGTPSPLPIIQEPSENIPSHPETPKSHRESRETIAKSPIPQKIEHQPLLKKSVPIPKTSILEERLKIPPKIEIPIGEVSRICEMPTTPKTSLLIQRDAKLANYQKMMESPKSSDKTELKIVDTPRKDSEKHDFENVGSPRIILKIAKSALADCGEPRSPKSPKIRSATNSPNPEDSPGQKLGKIKLKLSKGGHPSIIPNDNVEEVCGQWHTEGASSLSPLGMKIKFSKTGDASIVQADKHESSEEPKEQQPKHKFEEAKRTESPIGMKIKLSRTGDPSIVQQDAKESTSKHKDKLDIMQDSPKRTESPIGMKIKLSKSGDASIIQPEKHEVSDDHRETSRNKDKLDVPQDIPRRTESPLGMKIKLFKTGDASIVPTESAEDSTQEIKRTDSPLGMKIKLSKTRGGASIVSVESSEEIKEKLEVPEMPRRTESPLGMKIKLSKRGDASIIHPEDSKEILKHKERVETNQEFTSDASPGVKIKVSKCGEASTVQAEASIDSDVRTSSIGMKIKLSKTGDASIVHSDSQEQSEDSRSKERTEKTDPSIGMKIKLSKTGDASIIPNIKKSEDPLSLETIETESKKLTETTLGMKIKLQKSGEASIIETEKKDKNIRRKDAEMPLEMKIKLSKTGHPTIIGSENYGESSQRPKESETVSPSHAQKHKESLSPKENPGMKMLKSMQSANAHGGRSELTIEPIHLQSRKTEVSSEATSKRKDVTISPVESKKAKLEAKLSQMLPEVTIQPIKPRDPKQMMFDTKASSISRQQMNVISQEISITQVRSNKPMDLTMTDKLKSMLTKNTNPAASSDCEIIEHRPELIIVNENSNSSQEVMIIEEVPALRGPEAKIPKKRGRPRRNPLPLILAKPLPQGTIPSDPSVQRDPLALDDVSHMVGQMPPQNFAPKENERPKRTCSRQKSYAPPRRGRGRGGGRGKRKMEMSVDLGKKPRIEQDLDMIERSTTALITIDETSSQSNISHSTSELYKALRQPPMDSKMANAMARVEAEQAVNDASLMSKSRMESLMDSRLMTHLGGVMETSMKKSVPIESFDNERKMNLTGLGVSEDMVTDQLEKSELRTGNDKIMNKAADEVKEIKDTTSATDHQNWLTPSSKKLLDGRNEGNISNVQVIDEETRMSAESGSRSQTPARNMSVQASETIVNEESQGSVLSTATTESEKVKVKNRRMEINFDPDEGPFTVDKIAEYEWPPDPTRKSETFMIQEQISQYLGVKSFKRKYPDLKRRMVDMEERNFLRENVLVSEAMCDMGLTAVSSSEVLDVMCNDFPDQYEEYRKYIREKQMREHSKKQKELTAAANAERNRIDLAEMAVQSALSWNVGLNKARRESRKCSLDLQTFTIHVPKKQQKVEEESRVSHYPVALIPGQYTDYYREYTPAELRYYPLNTVLYGPMKPNERKFDSQSEGSQSDSDSDSSSDDSSSSSSDGTQDTEESQSTMDEVDVELSRQKEDIKSIKCKMCLKHLNKFSRTEVLIQCGTCNGYVHPSCIDLTLDMVPHIQAYAWQCTDCKTCAQCHDPADEDKMLFCDMCDRGYHIYCVGLRRVPQGRWHCQECAVCASCGSREAGGANSDRNSVAQWQHEYKKGDKNTRVYVSTLCVPCSKLWRKGRYCPHCSRCHTVPRLDLEANLVHCSACDKYLHLGCVETKDLTIDRKNYLCDFCQPSRQQMVKPLVSKVFRT